VRAVVRGKVSKWQQQLSGRYAKLEQEEEQKQKRDSNEGRYDQRTPSATSVFSSAQTGVRILLSASTAMACACD
jgi:hypothetical protein